ncbi:two-component system, sporulation sensor kinase E [Bacillus sp. OV322]|uniref:ATP-binding protein n=1 Tax=Bacillus sp. OV322 TaxID=1882764 RepID=UPI0008EBE478|nr:ATP-binding protein [Bacillus sp. OV322]SFC87001.1 two-component system, sporulation sensor kinase E [Bacillus sp. OV322]
MSHSRKIALKISIIYIILGVIWIIGSDSLSMALAQKNLNLYAFFQRYKGWLFIILTGIFLYTVIHNGTSKLVASKNELQKKNQQYQSIFIHNPDAVLELDLEGRITSINPAGEEILGCTADFLKVNQSFLRMMAGGYEKVKKYYYRALQGEASLFETVLHKLDGEKAILRCTFLPSSVNDQITGIVVIARDITIMRREEELMIASEKLSVIGHLAASVAHEIRNPLTSLKGFVQIMGMTKEVNEAHLEIMLTEIDRINIISSEMLILGKKQDVTFAVQDMNQIIDQVIMLMKAQANLDNIELFYKEKSVVPALVMADNIQLKQVLINIIKNGIEALEHNGEISITLTTDYDEVIVTVQDNGIGMEPERLNRIGEPFYSTKEKGTGIGLAVCKKIIERHKGKILFQSKKNEGTTVTIRIPLAVSP